MKVKLDANLGRRGQAILQAAGCDVSTAADENLATAPDREVLRACQVENRALLTLDRDFANPFVYPPREHAGIVVIRIPGKGTVSDIESALGGLLAHCRDETLRGRLLVADHRGRVPVYRRDE